MARMSMKGMLAMTSFIACYLGFWPRWESRMAVLITDVAEVFAYSGLALAWLAVFDLAEVIWAQIALRKHECSSPLADALAPNRSMPNLTMRDLFAIVAIAAILTAWAVDHRKLTEELKSQEGVTWEHAISGIKTAD